MRRQLKKETHDESNDVDGKSRANNEYSNKSKISFVIVAVIAPLQAEVPNIGVIDIGSITTRYGPPPSQEIVR